MRIDQLGYLTEVIRCGSLNKAARNLYITQPALSMAIDTLENELGYHILHRSKKGIELTARGKMIFEDCCNILSTVGNWKQAQPKSNSNIIINMETIYFGANYILPHIIPDIKQDYPEIDLRVQPIISNLKDSLQNSDADIIITGIKPMQSKEASEIAEQNGWIYEDLIYDQYLVFFSSKSPLASYKDISINDLKNYVIALYSYLGYYPYYHELESLNINNVILLPGNESILNLVSNNAAITFMTSLPGKLDMRTQYGLIQCAPIFDFTRWLNYVLIYRDYGYAKCVAKYIRQRFSQLNNNINKKF